MILTGSRSLAIRAPHILRREPVDFDYICTKEEFDGWIAINKEKIAVKQSYYAAANKLVVVGEDEMHYEFEFVLPGGSSEMIYDLVKRDPETLDTPFGKVPSLDMLFCIKTSHRYLKDSPYVWKTLIDWHAMRLIGAKVRHEYEAMLKLREKETYAAQKHPSLTNQTKESFFSAAHGVQYIYDHDSLHNAVKFLDKPAYLFYAKDNDPIKSDKTKFFAADPKIRLYGALEETSVLALERAIIPARDKWSSLEQAWRFALSKVITSITSGFFRQWCYENAFDILKAYPSDYYDRFERALASGVVKLVSN